MKVAFYMRLLERPGFDLEGFVRGTGASLSGSDGAVVRVANGLAKRGHDVTLLNHLADGKVGNLTAVRVGTEDLLPRLQELTGEVFVFTYAPGERCESLSAASLPGFQCKVLWDFNGIANNFHKYIGDGRVRRLICVSQTHANFYRHNSFFPRIGWVFNGTSGDFFSTARKAPEAARPTVLYVGALVESKGIHHVLREWAAVRARVPDAQLRVAGARSLHDPSAPTGPLGLAEPALEREVIIPTLEADGRNSAGASIQMLGALTAEKLRVELGQAWVCVVNPNPTGGATETCCTSAVEAMAAGVPVVTSDGGANVETLGPCAYYCRQPTDGQLADEVVRLLQSEEMRRKLAALGPLRVNALFDWEVLLPRWEFLLASALEDVPFDVPSPFASDESMKTLAREALRRSGMSDQVVRTLQWLRARTQ